MAAKIACDSAPGLSGLPRRLVAGFIYFIAVLGGDEESMYDLGFMIWQHEIPLLPERWGIQLIKKSARSGFWPAAVDLNNYFLACETLAKTVDDPEPQAPQS